MVPKECRPTIAIVGDDFFIVPIIYDLPWHPSSFPLMFLPSSILVIDPHHLFCSLLQFIVFLNMFFSKKNQNNKHKKNHLINLDKLI
jgi:hypothetical protein